MTKVAILPISNEQGAISYCAVAGDKQTQGKTAGEALDAMAAQLTDDDDNTVVVIQRHKPDRFFNANQQKRLAELMENWRQARDKGEVLASDVQAELKALVEAEFRASMNRAAALADELEK